MWAWHNCSFSSCPQGCAKVSRRLQGLAQDSGAAGWEQESLSLLWAGQDSVPPAQPLSVCICSQAFIHRKILNISLAFSTEQHYGFLIYNFSQHSLTVRQKEFTRSSTSYKRMIQIMSLNSLLLNSSQIATSNTHSCKCREITQMQQHLFCLSNKTVSKHNS